MTELIKKLGIHELVTRRELALEHVGRAWDECEGAREAVTGMFGGSYLYSISIFGVLTAYDRNRERAIEEYRVMLDTRIWRYLLQATQLGTLMGSKQRTQFERDLGSQVPHATLENIEATFTSMFERADDIFSQTVFDLFERLHPRYKAHESFGFDTKMIFSSAINYMGFGSRVEDIMMDLSKILYRLDGKPAPTRSTGIFVLVKQAYESDTHFNPIPGEVSTEYVRVKWFKNRNAHVWILREDLLEKMNDILAGHAPKGLASR